MTAKNLESKVDDIKISINNCYCCFNETNNRSPCKCKAYICKKCLKKYKKFETECKICNTDLIITDNFLYKKIKYINNLCISCCENLFINPVCIALLFVIIMVAIGLCIIIIPCFVFCVINSIVSNIPFMLIINFGFWITGVILIFIILLIIFLIIHICIGFWILMQGICVNL